MKFDNIENLKKRYQHIHPLIFHRSVERAETLGELFDILEEIPESMPIVWSHDRRRWVNVVSPCLIEKSQVFKVN